MNIDLKTTRAIQNPRLLLLAEGKTDHEFFKRICN